MAPPTVEDIVMLEMTIRGRVIVPAAVVEYECAIKKMHNVGFHDRKPALFVQCKDTADVQAALAFVNKHELPISVRSGGHSVCGSSLRDGTVVIDVGTIDQVSYDPATEEVTIGPGATLSSVNVYLLRLGRMTPNGVAPTTGCGGLCTQGGLGWLLHRFGLSVDNITKMNLILADGTVKDLDFKSEGEDKELFFAARGCAGSLGITTSFTMKTYSMEMVTGGFWLMLDDDSYTGTGKLIRLLREIAEEQESDSGTRTLFGGIYCMSVPPEELIPEEHHGKPCTGVLIASWGEDKAALGLVSQFVDREIVFGQPPAPMPFNIFNQLLSGPFLAFPPLAVYWKGAFTDSLPDDRIDKMLHLWSTHEPWLNASFVGIEFQGGVAGIRHAENLLGEDDHSVSGLRHFRFAFPFLMYFPPGNNEFFEKAQTMCRSLTGVWSDTNVTMYANYLADVGETAEEKKNESGLILGDRLSRVSAVKAKVDPNNIFYRSVLNISS